MARFVYMIDEFYTLIRGVGLYCLMVLLISGLLFTIRINFLVPSLYSLNETVPVAVIKKVKEDLIPSGVVLATASPLSAFSAQMFVSFVLAFVVLTPFGGYVLLRYVGSALSRKERLVLYSVLVPASILFLIGALFAYLVLLPFILSTLATHAAALEIPNYFFLGNFITFVLSLVVGTGVLFLLPVFMPVLTSVRLISAKTWLTQWRWSVITALLLSAVIANDGTGISMLLLALPIISCYFCGIFASYMVERFAA